MKLPCPSCVVLCAVTAFICHAAPAQDRISAESANLSAKTVYVGPAGRRTNPGTANAPLASLQQAVDLLLPGDTCVVQAGVYHESVVVKVSGLPDKPIQIVAEGEVLIDGTDAISDQWARQGAFYRIALPGPAVEQVFEDGVPLTPARWPNARFADTWIRSKWMASCEGSKKDLMICDALAETGIDWTGALAVLNVGHQYKTWTRPILSHHKGGREFTYDLAERLGDGKDDGRTWWDDRFYLTGTSKALDAPGEWFHDADAGYLYLVPETDAAPKSGSIAVKRRIYGFSARNVKYLQIRGFHFHACTFRIDGAQHVTIEECHIRFPQFTSVIGETLPAGEQTVTPHTSVSGDDNSIRKVYVAYGNGTGIAATGNRNRIEECIVHDVAWSGAINFPGILLTSTESEAGQGSTVTGCEVFNTGNIGIRFAGPANVVERNHVHHTGLACRDIAAIHTGSPRARGSVVRNNWVHHSMGKGIRGDDQTRGLTAHHNLVWSCDEGIIVKGDDNTVYHNTVIGSDGHGVLIIPTRQEPKKWWTTHEILATQNLHSRFFNNYCEAVVYRYDPIPQNGGISHNFSNLKDSPFEATLNNVSAIALTTEGMDPRPRPGSFLVDAGVVIDGVNDHFVGSAPDPGAYESGVPAWRPGPSWTAPDDVPLEVEAEVARSHALTLPAGRQSIMLPEKLRNSTLSEASLRKLQTLYDTCWTDAELAQRRTAITQRMTLKESSPEYKQHHAVVVELHRRATQRLVKRASAILSENELEHFYDLMVPKQSGAEH